jgi:2-aminoadipate transaminase
LIFCKQPRGFYCIPTHHNPSGTTLSLSERLNLIALCRQYDVILIADETYQYLNFSELPPPPLMCQLDSNDEKSIVLSLSSFSKILAPATRLGFIWSRRLDWIQKFGDYGLYQSGSNNNLIASIVEKYEFYFQSLFSASETEKMLIFSLLTSQKLDRVLQGLVDSYQHLRNVLCEGLDRLSKTGSVSHHFPEGGYFVWLRFCNDSFPDSSVIVRDALQRYNLQLTPGAKCVADGVDRRRIGARHVRLCFSNNTPEALLEATNRLSDLLDFYLSDSYQAVHYRTLNPDDADNLFRFFEALSTEDRVSFQPHDVVDTQQLSALFETEKMSTIRLGAFDGKKMVRIYLTLF